MTEPKKKTFVGTSIIGGSLIWILGAIGLGGTGVGIAFYLNAKKAKNKVTIEISPSDNLSFCYFTFMGQPQTKNDAKISFDFDVNLDTIYVTASCQYSMVEDGKETATVKLTVDNKSGQKPRQINNSGLLNFSDYFLKRDLK